MVAREAPDTGMEEGPGPGSYKNGAVLYHNHYIFASFCEK